MQLYLFRDKFTEIDLFIELVPECSEFRQISEDDFMANSKSLMKFPIDDDLLCLVPDF